MTLYNVRNIKKLFETVNTCAGDVKLVTPSADISLKTVPEVYKELLEESTPAKGVKELTLKTENADDCVKLMNFALAA